MDCGTRLLQRRQTLFNSLTTRLTPPMMPPLLMWQSQEMHCVDGAEDGRSPAPPSCILQQVDWNVTDAAPHSSSTPTDFIVISY